MRNGNFTIGEDSDNQILSAVSSYYQRVIDYSIANLAVKLSNSKDLPKFTKPIPIIIAGGTSQAKGFIEAFRKSLEKNGFPIAISEVRHSSDPLHAVAKGCLLASLV